MPGPRSGHSVAGSHARGTRPCVLAAPLPGEAGCVLRALRALAPVPGAAPASPRLSAATSQQVQPRAESKAQGAAAGAAGLRKSRDQLERRRCPLHPPRPHPNLPSHSPPTPQRPGNAEEQSEARAARLLPGRKEQASLINDWAVIAAGCALPAVCDGLSRPFWRQWPNVGALGLRAQGPRAPSITGSRQSRGGSIPAPARSLQTCALPTARAAASLRGAGVSTRVPSALGSRGPGSGQLPWPGQGPQVAPL